MLSVRPTVATIDLCALRHNLGVVRSRTGHLPVCAVIKANAYGHGAVEVARVLVDEGVAWLAVALLEEGVALREAGLCAPILVMGGAYEGGYSALVEHHLVPVVWTKEHLQGLERAARGRDVLVHVKVDTGMSRLGVLPEDLHLLIDALGRAPNIRLDGLMTHLADADALDRERNGAQLASLAAVVQYARAQGQQPCWVHAAASSACLSEPRAHHNLVRPGLALYGYTPVASQPEPILRPVLSWTTRPVRLETVPAGARASYGGRWTAPRPSRLMTLPVGYADGYRRALEGRAQVLVRGRRAPVVGAICMDLCVVDVTDVPGVTLADEVVLLGSRGGDTITADELAAWSGTIAYEILCGVSARVPRHTLSS